MWITWKQLFLPVNHRFITCAKKWLWSWTCNATFSIFILLYRSRQIYWRREPENRNKHTDHPQDTDTCAHIKLYRVDLVTTIALRHNTFDFRTCTPNLRNMIAVYIGYDVLIERSSRMVTKLVLGSFMTESRNVKSQLLWCVI